LGDLGDLLRVGRFFGRVRTKKITPRQNFFVYSLYIFIFSIKVKIKKWGIFQTGGNG